MSKKLKITVAILLCVGVALGILTFVMAQNKTPSVFEQNGLKYVSKTEGKDFYIYSDKKWNKTFLKGVNIGASNPGHFPGELAITKDEYLRWFQYISDMNADVIRVYTTMKPDFYDALYEFNQDAKKPLYLMQGVWVSEEDIAKLQDAYAGNGKIEKEFIKDATDLVDIIHGHAVLPARAGFASGKYTSDVSPYVIGWIMGIEWDPFFVKGTNDNNPEKGVYAGKFLYTKGASPFEVFLSEVGDSVLTYEASTYKMVRPLSFANWPTTDMLAHPNEPNKNEDMASVNMEHIIPQKDFAPGVFASYHIYPYYPDFLNYQKDYISFKGKNGKIDTYKAYLQDLIKHHTMPVLIAEFGVPASRGKAHDSLYSGYNQGNHDETEQGSIDKALLQDIYDEGYLGALIFSWQDEWFKRTWNTMDFDLPDRRPYWSNPQANEQEFGLLAFDPGKDTSVCYVDGDVSEWNGDKPVYSTDNAKIYLKSDEKYMYLMVKTKGFDFTGDSLYIPIDSIRDQGNSADKANGLAFDRPADFLIQIKGKNDSRILVDSYYDSFYYMYAEQLGMIAQHPEFSIKDNGIFNPMYLCLNRTLHLPQDNKTVPFSKYETGLLKYGDANPKDSSYNSLTDFAYKGGNIEIRIPWQLLNVMEPSTKQIMGDLYKNKAVKAETADGMYFGVGIVKNGAVPGGKIGLGYYTWQKWDMPTYHERLKPSYYIMQAAFKNLK